MLLWLSRFFPRLAGLDLPGIGAGDLARAPAAWAAAAALLLGLALARRRAVLRRALYAGAAGFSGMLLESVLLLHYQTRSGVLYQDLGLLLTAFMGGLALGAWALERLAGTRGPGRRAGLLVPAALAALAAACAPLVGSGAAGALPVVAALLAAGGALVAAAFAWAVLRGAPEAGAVVGPVYAADLAGGCLGGLVAGLAAIPMLGLPATAVLAALAALAALVLV